MRDALYGTCDISSLQEVTCLDFHPVHQILVSGSKDYSIRFFEFSKPSVKKAYKSIQEAAEIHSVSFHPSGDFLLAGTQQKTSKWITKYTLIKNSNYPIDFSATMLKFSV